MGSDEYGNKYYKNKKNERWVIYSKNVEATKFHLTGIYGCIIPLIKFLTVKILSFLGKKNKEDQTGTADSYKPIKISKNLKKKYETWK